MKISQKFIFKKGLLDERPAKAKILTTKGSLLEVGLKLVIPQAGPP
jgi:hypothetical protein